MTRSENLADILAALKALAAELKAEPSGDDGIPVLTAAVAAPARVAPKPRSFGTPIPTLSAIVARPEGQPQVDAFAESQAQAARAQTRAQQTLRRLHRIWQESGHEALDPAIIAALEKALVEALQNEHEPNP